MSWLSRRDKHFYAGVKAINTIPMDGVTNCYCSELAIEPTERGKGNSVANVISADDVQTAEKIECLHALPVNLAIGWSASTLRYPDY